MFQVIYRGKSIEPGDYLYDSRTPLEPKVIWEAKNNTFYTLYMSGMSCINEKRFFQNNEILIKPINFL